MDAFSISGLQGTGKTTLARALGRAIGAVVFSRDPLMDVLHAEGVPDKPSQPGGLKSYPEIGYDLQTALLRTQLELGQSVVLECVVGAKMRANWRNVADEAGATFWLIDTVCSDPEVHRRRFVQRGPTGRGDWSLAWETVERHWLSFRPHPEASYIADSVNPVEDNVRAIVEMITSTRSNALGSQP